MTTNNFEKFAYGDYHKSDDRRLTLASLLPSVWNYFENLTWFGPSSLYQHIQKNYPSILKQLKTSTLNMLPTNIGSIDLDAVIMRDEPKWNEEMKTYDFAYMTTPKFTNYYSDMRTSGYNDHYVFVPLDRTYHVDEIFTSLRQQYYVGESVTRKLAYGLVYNEILHMWWHGDSVLVPKIKSFENDDAKKNSIDFINDYIPVDIAMNMNADQEYIVFEKSYIPIVQSMAEEYVNLMNYLIDGSTNSATRILHENDKHDFKVVLNVTD